MLILYLFRKPFEYLIFKFRVVELFVLYIPQRYLLFIDYVTGGPLHCLNNTNTMNGNKKKLGMQNKIEVEL